MGAAVVEAVLWEGAAMAEAPGAGASVGVVAVAKVAVARAEVARAAGTSIEPGHSQM